MRVGRADVVLEHVASSDSFVVNDETLWKQPLVWERQLPSDDCQLLSLLPQLHYGKNLQIFLFKCITDVTRNSLKISHQCRLDQPESVLNVPFSRTS